MNIKQCVVCNNTFEPKAFFEIAKYCSDLCKSRNKNYEKKCRYCEIKFIGKKKQNLCSLKCVGYEQRDRLIKGNKSRRKYEFIFGLTRQQIWKQNNKEKMLEHYHKDNLKRIFLLIELGSKCVKCNYNADVRALELDHKFNDGYLDRKIKGRCGKIYRYYSKNLDEAKERLQILCSNCNKIKQIEEKEFCKLRKKK